MPYDTFREKDKKHIITIKISFYSMKEMPSTTEETIDKILNAKPIGIVNIGNTCYVNATFQLLVRSRDFLTAFYNIPEDRLLEELTDNSEGGDQERGEQPEAGGFGGRSCQGDREGLDRGAGSGDDPKGSI